MATPVDNQAISKPKHSRPDDLTKFITRPHHDRDHPVACGGFGSVYKCTYNPAREEPPMEVAVKAFRMQADEIEDPDALWREVGVWKRVRHECIVPLLGSTTHYSPVSLVSPWMPNGTLSSYLRRPCVESQEKYRLLHNVADGLHYLHSESVIHGDLTSLNVLIDEKGQACLTDFGLSSMVKMGEKFNYLRLREKQPGAVRWSAPELIDEDGDGDGTSSQGVEMRYMPSPSSDIYSYGCIMFEVLSGDVPWKDRKQPIVVILKGKTPERPQSQDMQDEDWIFILQCWLSLPSLRPVASQALKFARTRLFSEFRETSSQTSIYSAHLDGANVYNLSSLVPSHTQPAFSDPAKCWMSVDKLAKALIDLFTTKKNQHGLNDAIQLYHVSLASLPPTFITSSLREVTAAIAQIGTDQRVDENLDAIERLRFRMGSVDIDDPFHFTGSSYLSLVDIAKHMTDEDSGSISSAKHWYKKSFSNDASGVLCRLQMALACARIAERVVGQDEFRLEAYEMSLELLQSHISATHTVSWAVEHLSTSLAVDAAATALCLKNVNKAVELLEWGRELLWAYIARQSHASEKGDASEEGDTSEEGNTSEEGEKQVLKVEQLHLFVNSAPSNLQETSSLKSAAVPDAKVHEILEAEGTPSLHPQISDLLKATQDGPVIMLIASRRSCDAIIVSNTHPEPLHIQLKISFSSLAALSTTFQVCTSSVSEDSDAIEAQLKEVLRCLWDDVVAPVIVHLEESIPPRHGSRIWWCPTSFFSTLPVHAAGDYTPEGTQLPQLYVSSYTSSISSLVRARECVDHPESSSKFAAIYQAKPLQNDEKMKVEYPVIEFAAMEPDAVKRNLPSSLFLTKFPDATKEDANKAFSDHGWFHLVAYATQNAYKPFNSSFVMRDGLLSLPDILLASSEPKEFAFLSARPVGSRFRWMQNETIQFAAGLQFSGFKSVVGTMGTVEDSKAHEIIRKFYRTLFSTETPDCTRAARALHDALEEMARDGLSLGQRVIFAHFGL
ncbi:hypothetical protein DFH29DRAFT_950612 [Suillus ampliporus]|nr:hypothetical protein DFH29DRAFT_950612 [Suillus ampliporus]